jgi:hypothetical protein
VRSGKVAGWAGAARRRSFALHQVHSTQQEDTMSTTSYRRTFAALTAGAALAAPATATAIPAPDHPAGSETELLKNYDMNSAGGTYAPAVPGSASTGSIHGEIGPPVRDASLTAGEDSGFAWSDAAAGAGVALLLAAGSALIARATLGRRRSAARLGS